MPRIKLEQISSHTRYVFTDQRLVIPPAIVRNIRITYTIVHFLNNILGGSIKQYFTTLSKCYHIQYVYIAPISI